MYYLNSRYYNPYTGKFLNADWLLGANEDEISYNLYAYVSNNPINMLDENEQGKIKIIINIIKNPKKALSFAKGLSEKYGFNINFK